MMHGLGDPSLEAQATDGATDQIVAWLASLADEAKTIQTEALLPWEPLDLCSQETLSGWCDRTLGVDRVGHQRADGEMVWSVFWTRAKPLGSCRAAAHVLSLLRDWSVRCRVTTAGSDGCRAKKSTRWMIVPKKRCSMSLAAMGIPCRRGNRISPLHHPPFPDGPGYISGVPEGTALSLAELVYRSHEVSGGTLVLRTMGSSICAAGSSFV